MKTLIKYFISVLLFSIISINLNAQCNNNIVVNGSFDNAEGEDVVVSGWNHSSVNGAFLNTPDVNDENGLLFTTVGYIWAGIPIASPDGGTWQNSFGPEAYEQTVSLTIGQTYILKFYYAAMGITTSPSWPGYASPNGVDVYFDGVIVYTSPDDNTQYTWELATYVFTATSSNLSIAFSASHDDMYIGVDGVCIEIGSIEAIGDEICENETAQVSVIQSFGVAPYTYSWSNGLPNTEGPHDVTPTQTTEYYVTVTDDIGQSFIDTALVIVNPTPSVELGNDTSLCDGGIFIANAGSQYSYLWNTSDIVQNITIDTTGTYDVTVTNIEGCTATDNITINFGALEIDTSITHINCFNGTNGNIEVSIVNGATPVTYAWSNGNNTNINTNLIASTYTVTITDANNCVITETYTLNQPSQILIQSQVTNIQCYGALDGNIDLSVTGGVGSYTFSWDNTTQTSEDINNLSANTYTVTVSDANSCTSSNSAIITQPTQLITQANPTNVSCFGLNDGEIDLDITGGIPPYSYNWSDGSNTEDINNLNQNLYFVTVEDANNCTVIDTGIVSEPFEIQIIPNANSILCYGDETGIIDLSVSGGIEPYIYNWSNQTNMQSLNNIPAGTYFVTITDDSNCSKIESVTINQPNALIVNLPSGYIHCNHNTELLASVEGGTTPYSYQWNTGVNTQNTQYQTNQTATYSITVTDNNGCTSNDDITINIISVELDAFVNNDTVCPGDPVLVTTNINGGMPPYTIYDDGQIVSFPVTIYPNGQQSYNLQVVDACGNTDNAMVDINTYPIPQLSFNSDVLQGCPPLTVSFNQNNYDNNFTYTWIFGDNNHNNLSLQTNPVHVFNQTGLFDISLQVTDNNGCNNQLTIQNMIEVYPIPDAMFESSPDVVSIIDPSIEFINYSVDNYNNFWSFGDGDSSLLTDPIHDYELITDYMVTLVVENEYGCRDTAVHRILVQDVFTLYAPTAFTPDNDGINDGFKAVGHGIDLDNYYIAVYDRWGAKIWSSTDLLSTWGGKAKDGNRTVQNGTYKWLVVCKDFNGVEHTKSGNVTVIR